MATPTSAAVDRAVAYVYRQGRPIDCAELAFHLGRGRADSAIEVLYAYRNIDGGFGHAIEPDVRHPGSTVLATCTALQTLVRLKADAYHPLVQGAMRFLVESYDLKTQNWPLVTAAAKDAPCAPWWKGYDTAAPSPINPRAEILSYFIRFDHGRHESLFEEIRRQTLARLGREQPLDMHEVQSAARLLRTPGIDPTIERTTREALERDLPKLLPKTKADCKAYVLKPLTIARRPNSVLAGLVNPAVPLQHEYELETQSPDGAWSPAWSWSDQDPTAWAQAEREWKSQLTTLTASSLHAYGR